MKLHPPFEITPRLMAGVRIDGTFISIEMGPRDFEGRNVYTYHIDLPKSRKGFTCSDLKSGRQGGSLQEGMESLLSFMGACAESFPDGENANMFPRYIAEWCSNHEDEISMLQCEIQESENLIEA